ncbi:MAG: cation-translocating P-type ATPase [Patescibacteria group bacterium]
MSKFSFRIAFESALSSVLALFLILYYSGVLETFHLIYLVIVIALLGTAPVLVSAARSIFARDWASMDLLASVALLFSLISHEWASSAFIALMLSAARLLTVFTESRTEKNIESLLKLRPESAKVERGEKMVVVPVEDLVVGDIVIVDIGERIPVDGSVISGEAAVDESSLTGESLPVDKVAGAKTFSSTLVASGNLRIKTEKVGKDTTLEKIIVLVKSSREQHSKIYTLAERFGRAYLILIFISAIALFVFTRNVQLVLAVVLVVCADDVAIAVPLAYLNAIGSAAKRGVIVKGSSHLEALGRATTFVFDKTGTLTKGNLKVTGVYCAEECSEEEVLRYSSIASQGSKHPLSRAIMEYAKEKGIADIAPDASRSIGGKGIVATYKDSHIIVGRMTFLESEGIVISKEVLDEAGRLGDQGQSVSLTARNGHVIGIVALADEIKDEAKPALQALRELGAKRLIMLTGDNAHVAEVVARELGMDEWHGGLLPEDKVLRLQELRKSGEVVMVGDGVNDAAALATATVGIAMGAIGYDTAIESAAIVLMRDDLGEIPETMKLARFVHEISLQDFWIWGGTNVFGLLLVFTGFIGPTGAAAYNFVSDFFPLANSLRTRRFQAVQGKSV